VGGLVGLAVIVAVLWYIMRTNKKEEPVEVIVNVGTPGQNPGTPSTGNVPPKMVP